MFKKKQIEPYVYDPSSRREKIIDFIDLFTGGATILLCFGFVTWVYLTYMLLPP
ncbi:hypothetical protein IKF81_01690 [Candidatus Saccharibacteria bacterium]|nr:hypothetical protein [Candidatus Saccharibacteria bacterium]